MMMRQIVEAVAADGRSDGIALRAAALAIARQRAPQPGERPYGGSPYASESAVAAGKRGVR
jgi:hypothetical protein